MKRHLALVAAGLAAAAAAGVPVARADSPTHTYTFSNSLPIDYAFCFGSAGCMAPRSTDFYPSPITVSGVTGHVVNVTVTLHNLTLYGGSASPIEGELQGPSGTSVLMAAAGGSGQPRGVDLTFAGGYPSLTDATISGTYAPTVNSAPSFPSPAPAAAADLSQSVNQDPNGAWNLWLATTDTLLQGSVGGGWQLTITTTPYANTSSIALPEPATVGLPARAAATYPSPVTVSGLTGVVASVRPTLAGLSSVAADDLDFLLADPGNDSALLMADAGGRETMGAVVTNLGLTFDDSAPNALPDNTPLFGGTFRPSVYDDGPPGVFPSPAPAGPYPSTLSTFAGRDPNGTWNLFGINDGVRGASGSTLNRGWDLDITTRPASPVALSAATLQATRGRPLSVAIDRGAPATGPATVALSTGGGSAVAGTDYTPVSTTVVFAPGETSKTVTIPILSAGTGGTFDVTLASPTDDAALSTPSSSTATIPRRGPPAGGTAPVLTAFRLAPTSFRATTRGASIARHTQPTGTTLNYRDSQPATTQFTVERRAPGLRRHGRCVAPPRRRHAAGHSTSCTRHVALGTFRHLDVAGPNRLRFTGRVHRNALPHGRYTLVATPRNAAGLSGSAVSRAFRIR